MYKSLVALAVFLLVSNLALSQEKQDLIIRTDIFSKYIGYTCLGRDSLVNAVLQKDIIKVKRLKQITVIYESGEFFLVHNLASAREQILLQFLTNEFEDIVNDIKYFRHYFNVNYRNCNHIFHYSYECGNLTTELIHFWKENSEEIEKEIRNSTLQQAEKDLLILYYKNILLYIDADDVLPYAFNENAKIYNEKYNPGSFSLFTEELSVVKKKSIISALSANMNFGSGIVFGDIKRYLKNSFLFSAELGYIYSDFQFKLGYKSNFFNYRDTLRLNNVDSLTLSQSIEMYHHGFVTNFGFYFFNKNRIKAKSFINLEVNRFVNRIPDEGAEEGEKDYFSQKGKSHYNINFGLEGGYQLFPIKEKVGEYNYYPREEKDKYYHKFFLNTGLAYQPPFFDHINSEGGLWYWYIGIEGFLGMKRARYYYSD